MLGPLVSVSATDYHTAGEPFRIVSKNLPSLVGRTVLDKRAHALANEKLEAIRKLLVNEPRGHADMYGGFIVEPNDEGAHFGVLFWHGDGYSTACGHGTIALGAWAIDAGILPANPEGDTTVTIDVPSGRVQALVKQKQGVIREISFKNVFSHVVATEVPMTLDSGREISVDIAYGGANYATVAAATLGTSLDPKNLDELIRVGREIKHKLELAPESHSHTDERLNGIYGTIIYEEVAASATEIHQKNITIYADGRVDRSPCGSGTAARIAQLESIGSLKIGMTLNHESIVGTKFRGHIESLHTEVDQRGVFPVITGLASRTSNSVFQLFPDDEIPEGFSLR